MIPSGNTTQRVTRVQSPVREALDASMMPAQQAAAQLAAMAAPNSHGMQHVAATHNAEDYSRIVPKITRQEMIEAGTEFFCLRIIDKQTTGINYNPKNAIDNTNANLQNYVASFTGIPDLPTSIYQVSYRDPEPDMSSSAKKYGYFLIGVPAPVYSIMPDATHPTAPDGPLAFTADDDGNNYKLEFEEYLRKETKSYDRIAHNDPHWFHIVPREDCTLPPMQIKEQTQNHITKFGISIRDHEEAFAKVMTKDKTRSLNKYHVWYILNKDAVNTIQTPTGPTIDMRGIQRFKLESEESNEFASIVFHKEPMERALSSCHICYAPLYVCGGCKEPVKQIKDGKRPMTSAQNVKMAQLRLGKKVKSHAWK